MNDATKLYGGETSPTVKKTDKRKRLMKRATAMKTERASWLETWRDIADNMAPNRLREQRTDANKGRRNDKQMINFTPREAARTLASGMASGISSPSRPWFRLTMGSVVKPGQQRNHQADFRARQRMWDSLEGTRESKAVKKWLGEVEDIIREAFVRSNLYGGLANIYEDIGPFGTAAQIIEEDAEDGVRAYHLSMGTYCIATGARGGVDTLYREVAMTASQLVDMFGEEYVSDRVREAIAADDPERRFTVAHMIYPNRDFTEGAIGPRGKKFASDWWECEAADSDGFLRESGYSECPFQAPRWSVHGEDAYGRGPGWDVLGDCRALQKLERRVGQATEKIVNPPMVAPSQAVVSLLPGEVTRIDPMTSQHAMRAAVDIKTDAVTVGEAKIRQHEDRIRRGFYAHLWLMLTQSDGPEMTAREVDERREEKLQQLGVVLEQLFDELLDPMIDRVFYVLLRMGRIPPPPEEIQGLDYGIDYISIMAQAQKALAVTGISRVANFVLSLGEAYPDILDVVDFEELVFALGEAVGVDPRVLRTPEAIEELRAARAEAQQKMAAQQEMMAGAETAKTLGDTKLENGNALTEILRGLGVR